MLTIASCNDPHLFVPTSVEDSGNGGGGDEVPCIQPASLEPPEDGAWILHQVGVLEANNVSLNEDGTVHGTLFGCDFIDAFRGRWAGDAESILILPNHGEELEWFDKVEPVLVVRLTSGDDDTILAEAFRESGMTVMTLAEGRICTCCAGLGPDNLRACDGPLPESPFASRVDCRPPCSP